MNDIVILHKGTAPAWAELGSMEGLGAKAWLAWEYVPSVDAEVPLTVRRTIARAVTAVGAMTFVVGEAYASMRVAEVPRGWLSSLRQRQALQGTTVDPLAAETLFDDPLQAWWLGTAAAIVSSSFDTAPVLSAQTWRALMGSNWTKEAAGLTGVDGVLRAGVDGGVAGWWSRTDSHLDRFASALRQAVTISN